MNKALVEFDNNSVRKNYWIILLLHSRITIEEQSLIFQSISRLTPNFRHLRKIIPSTNTAESSITVTDITHIIDFCLMKQLVTDPETNFCSLKVFSLLFLQICFLDHKTDFLFVFRLVGMGFQEQLEAAQMTCRSCFRRRCISNNSGGISQ